MSTEKRAIVIGGGPAGMMASYIIAQSGVAVTLLEKNRKLGKKMLISGKGRCNVTNDSDGAAFLEHMPGNGKFLYSAYRGFTAADTMAWFENRGVPLKTERGSRVFPVSDRSADIVGCMERALWEAGAEIRPGRAADGILLNGGRAAGVEVGGTVLSADAILVATGGISYPLTGSDGDGYTFAESAGHTVTELFPSLVPLKTAESFVAELEGLSLRNVAVTLCYPGEKPAAERRFGEMVFTADGVSGPVILTLSRRASLWFLEHRAPLELVIDLKPALSEEELDRRLLRELEANGKKDMRHVASTLLPRKLIPVFLRRCGLDGGRKGHSVTKAERALMMKTLKAFTLTVRGRGRVEEAIVTGGGVSVREVDPKTMMSKKAPGLFFAGEVLDIDGYTGGFNIQAALSTGHQAGKGIVSYCREE
ncbi:MAG: NAD(P)/FAD-dependent oxidoreductase [Bacillota bacterium]